MKPWVRQWVIALGVALLVGVVATVFGIVNNNTTYNDPALAINPLVLGVLLGVLVVSIIAAFNITARWALSWLLLALAGLAAVWGALLWSVVKDPCRLSPDLATSVAERPPPDPCAGFATRALTLATFAAAMLFTAAYRMYLERRTSQLA